MFTAFSCSKVPRSLEKGEFMKNSCYFLRISHLSSHKPIRYTGTYVWCFCVCQKRYVGRLFLAKLNESNWYLGADIGSEIDNKSGFFRKIFLRLCFFMFLSW